MPMVTIIILLTSTGRVAQRSWEQRVPLIEVDNHIHDRVQGRAPPASRMSWLSGFVVVVQHCRMTRRTISATSWGRFCGRTSGHPCRGQNQDNARRTAVRENWGAAGPSNRPPMPDLADHDEEDADEVQREKARSSGLTWDVLKRSRLMA